MIEVLKWYSIILMCFSLIHSFKIIILSDNKIERIGTCIGILFNIPILLYLVIK